MEGHQQLKEDSGSSGGGSGGNKAGGGGNFLCRQSSTRWTPTSDQIRILKDLYYNSGVRSPTADQIQRISARLRQYGKIEGKNVFYWFQNHKARERQKKRFTTSNTTTSSEHVLLPMQRPSLQSQPHNNGVWKQNINDQDSLHQKFSNISHPSAAPASAGVLTAIGAQMGNYGSYGSVTMENRFKDCSISPTRSSTGSGNGGSINHHGLGNWVSIDHYSASYNFFDKRKSVVTETIEEEEEEEGKEEEEDDQEEEDGNNYYQEKETLPLFPMHGEDHIINGGFFRPSPSTGGYYPGWYRPNDGNYYGGSHASLELSLNTYTGRSPDSL